MDQDEIRTQQRSIRAHMSVNEVEQYSAAIDERVYSFIDEHPAIRSILCYYPKGNEVALLPLYEKCSGMYRLYFPVTRGERLLFCETDGVDAGQFHIGAFGIMEPSDDSRVFPQDETEEAATLAIIPGLAFSDESRGRIGYGKGYYDRFLAAYPAIYKLGVCYDFQVIHDLPQNAADVPMDLIMTNTDRYE